MASISAESNKTVVVVALVVLFSGFGLLLAGEWAPSVGYMGLVRYLCIAAGFVLFALSFVGFAIMLAMSSQKRKGGVGAGFAATAARFVREVGRFAVACIAYAGSAFVALAVIVAFGEGAPTPVRLVKLVVVLAVCVGVAVSYRFYRKKHPASYDTLGSAGIAALFMLLTIGSLAIGFIQAKDSLIDLLRGPQTELCWLADVEENRATGRYRGFRQDALDMTFETVDERRFHISVAEGDRDKLSDIVDAEGVVWLTYFPETGVFVSAEPGMEDYVNAGGE